MSVSDTTRSSLAVSSVAASMSASAVVESTSHRDIWCDGANVEVSPLRIIDPDLQAVKYIPTAVRGATWTAKLPPNYEDDHWTKEIISKFKMDVSSKPDDANIVEGPLVQQILQNMNFFVRLCRQMNRRKNDMVLSEATKRLPVDQLLCEFWDFTDFEMQLEREIYLRKSYDGAPSTAISNTLIFIEVVNNSALSLAPSGPKLAMTFWGKPRSPDVGVTFIAFAVEYKQAVEIESRYQLAYDLSTALTQRRVWGMPDYPIFGATCHNYEFRIYKATWMAGNGQVYKILVQQVAHYELNQLCQMLECWAVLHYIHDMAKQQMNAYTTVNVSQLNLEDWRAPHRPPKSQSSKRSRRGPRDPATGGGPDAEPDTSPTLNNDERTSSNKRLNPTDSPMELDAYHFLDTDMPLHAMMQSRARIPSLTKTVWTLSDAPSRLSMDNLYTVQQEPAVAKELRQKWLDRIRLKEWEHVEQDNPYYHRVTYGEGPKML